LQINNICITHDSQKWLLNSARKIPTRQFYNNKFGWNASTFDNIAWNIQNSAIKSFLSEDHTRILKFVHGWLPTASQTFKEGTSTSQRCQIRHAPREDNFHLFYCNNRKIEAIQEKIQQYIVKDMHDHGDSKVSNIIKIGILNAGLDSNWVPSINDISRKWKAAVRDQSRIGWDHLLRGCILRTLIQSMNQHFESQNLSVYLYNGDRWAKMLITTIWSTMLELWKTQNNIIYLHDTCMAEAKLWEKLATRIRSCYEQRSILKAQERAHWFSMLLEAQLQQDAQ
jgi:hypothetical protein